jgi:hypothetical protein
MTRIVLASALLVLIGVAMTGCSDPYTQPSRAISADIAASRAGGSATLLRNQTLDLRDTDLSSRRRGRTGAFGGRR